jgi:hypothetical protein
MIHWLFNTEEGGRFLIKIGLYYILTTGILSCGITVYQQAKKEGQLFVKDFFSGDAIGTFIFGFLIIPMVSIGKFIELINTKPLWQSKDKKMKKVLYEDECNS